MRVAVSRAPGTERAVRPLELFFDLVYVFALAQLSHHLAEHVDLRTGVETAILALAVIHGWYMTSWGMNWLDPDRPPVRLLLVGLMFASLLMSVAIPDAFGDELAIAHPGDDATLGFTILAFGGPALFLLAQLIFNREAVGRVPRSRPLGLAALAILAVATAPLSMIAGLTAATAVLVWVAIADTMRE